VEHAYVGIARLQVAAGTIAVTQDMRPVFPPLGGLTAADIDHRHEETTPEAHTVGQALEHLGRRVIELEQRLLHGRHDGPNQPETGRQRWGRKT